MRYFLHIGYDGSSYRGWQFQVNQKNTLQETIEKKLEILFKEKVTVYGCGRTDAGVHASQYFIHINLNATPPFDLKYVLNKHLPTDIVVFDVIPVANNQHCRYDATARTYDYFVHFQPDPMLWKYSTLYENNALDFEAMQKAAETLANYKDFRAFCKQPDTHNNTLCTVTFAKLYVNSDQSRMRFCITANRFLKGMIRIIVGAILRVGNGEMSLEEFEQRLIEPVENKSKKPALPNGLYLSKIIYPYLNLPPQTNITDYLKVGLTDEN